MLEEEALKVLKECIPIYNNLHDVISYKMNAEDIKWLNELKIIWDHPLDFEDSLIEQAGMNLFQFAFLGGAIYQLDLKKVRAELFEMVIYP